MVVFPGLMLLKLLAVFPQEELTASEAVRLAFVAQREVSRLAPERHSEVFGDRGHLQYAYILSYSPFPFHSLPFSLTLVLKLSFQLIVVSSLMETLDNKAVYTGG